MRVRTVFFDFGGTLMAADPTMAEPWRTWVGVADALGLGLSEADLRTANEEADQRFGARIYDYHGRTKEFWRMRDLWAIDRLGVRDRREEFFDRLQERFDDPGQVRPYPETRNVLRDLAAEGFRLGVISNFSDRILDLLDHHRLRDFFDTVTYSQAVGAAKPDPRVFEAALRAARCAPQESLHVGDSWDADYQGARLAGMHAAWLNRQGEKAPEACTEIPDLRGVRALVRG